MAGTALLCQLVIQAAINIGVVTAMLPPKGISHPFISYGGSSLMVSCAAVGIILSLARSPVEDMSPKPTEALDPNQEDLAHEAFTTEETAPVESPLLA
ncbi:MAG: FtsW/RodA/SpoVE family cell cycle protein [Planctomycetaceae bacterium]|nr:FtsW/RodA/SpoVE family cell cycle protein [Planctomycetaceae bacterium]